MARLKNKWITSESATSGQFLKADGSGGTAWGTVPVEQIGDTFRWVISGAYSTGISLDGAWLSSGSGAISEVIIYRREAGNGGDTVVDVNKNGTTIFTNQANRPSVAATDGDNAIDTVSPDVTTFSSTDYFLIDIDEKESGSPKDLTVILRVIYD